MAVNPLQITAKTAVRGRPFEKGRSGDGAPRPGAVRGTTPKRFMEEMLDGEAEGLARKVVALALGGDPNALRLCFERILAPRRERPVQLDLPPIPECRRHQGRDGRDHDKQWLRATSRRARLRGSAG